MIKKIISPLLCIFALSFSVLNTNHANAGMLSNIKHAADEAVHGKFQTRRGMFGVRKSRTNYWTNRQVKKYYTPKGVTTWKRVNGTWVKSYKRFKTPKYQYAGYLPTWAQPVLMVGGAVMLGKYIHKMCVRRQTKKDIESLQETVHDAKKGKVSEDDFQAANVKIDKLKKQIKDDKGMKPADKKAALDKLKKMQTTIEVSYVASMGGQMGGPPMEGPGGYGSPGGHMGGPPMEGPPMEGGGHMGGPPMEGPGGYGPPGGHMGGPGY